MKAAVLFIFARTSGFSFTLFSLATASGLARSFILKAGSFVALRRRSLRFLSSLTKSPVIKVSRVSDIRV